MDRGSREHFMSLVFENASSVRQLVLQFEDCEKEFELETVSLRKQILELKEKEEERLKVVEEKERKLEFLEKSINERLQEKEKESEADLTRFVVEMQVKEVVNQLKEKEKSLGLLQDSTVKKHEELMRELEEKKKEFGLLEDSMEKKHEALMRKLEALKEEARLVEDSLAKKNEGLVKELEGWKEEVGLLSNSIFEHSSELDIEMNEFELKQKEESEKRKKEAEVMETSIKKLEAIKEEVGLISKSIDEKSCALVMEVKEFDLKKTAESEKRKEEADKLEAKEKELNLLNERIKKKTIMLKKKEKKFQLKQKAGALMIKAKKKKFLCFKEKELEERERNLKLKQRDLEEESKTRKRTRLEFRSSSLAEKGIDADSVIPPVKKQNSIRKHNRNDEEEKETDPVAEHTTNSFAVGQIWALYDSIDYMPRDYARINTVSKPELSVQVTRLEPLHNTSNEKPSIPMACGRFEEGASENKNHLLFSHEMMNPIVVGKDIFINPLIGETWALFRDWKKTWNTTQKELHKPPYKYDFVEVESEFDEVHGIAVAYLGRVEGFTSVYQQAEQHGFIRRMISPDEMFRFSHKVPSFKLTGDEEQGVPPGSFQLDPAVLVSVM